MNYVLTDTTLNHLYQLGRLLERLCFLPSQTHWQTKHQELMIAKQSFSSVAIGRNLTDPPTKMTALVQSHLQLNEADASEYQHYLTFLTTNLDQTMQQDRLSLELIEKVFASITGQAYKPGQTSFRQSLGTVSKVIWEHNIKKIIDLEVTVKAEDIPARLDEFVEWYNHHTNALNPFILAALTHYKIAEIHPYPDANGRLSRALAKWVLMSHGLQETLLISPEYYFYLNRELYFDTISETISSQNLSKWLEFYSKALLESVYDTFHDLFLLSGTSVDLNQRKIIALTEREGEVLEILTRNLQASAAEVGKMLKVSRQNANVILKRLVEKGLLTTVGRSTSLRYSVLPSN